MDDARTLLAWHDAVNAGEVDEAVALCSPDVVVGGPRGSGTGHDLMRSWLTRSGVELDPQDTIEVLDGVALVHEHARWTTTDDAQVQLRDAPPQDTWLVFEVSGGLLTAVRRFESEAEAVAAAGL